MYSSNCGAIQNLRTHHEQAHHHRIDPHHFRRHGSGCHRTHSVNIVLSNTAHHRSVSVNACNNDDHTRCQQSCISASCITSSINCIGSHTRSCREQESSYSSPQPRHGQRLRARGQDHCSASHHTRFNHGSNASENRTEQHHPSARLDGL